jgi:RNA polymerase sigma factor (sigma-70 family)
LRRVVLNEYLGWRRRRWSTEVVSSPLVDDAATAAVDAHAASDDRDLIWRLLGALAPRARAVLVQRYYEDLPDAEIAEHLGCAEATVRGVAARAFTTLRADPQLADFLPARPLEKEA